MEFTASVQSMKSAYDQVVGSKQIQAKEIQGWITSHGKVLGKDRLMRIAMSAVAMEHDRVESTSGMKLMYDTMFFAIRKSHQELARKVNWMVNEVYPMDIDQDLRVLFDKWEEEMMEVQQSGMITEDMIVQSMHTLMQIFQP